MHKESLNHAGFINFTFHMGWTLYFFSNFLHFCNIFVTTKYHSAPPRQKHPYNQLKSPSVIKLHLVVNELDFTSIFLTQTLVDYFFKQHANPKLTKPKPNSKPGSGTEEGEGGGGGGGSSTIL